MREPTSVPEDSVTKPRPATLRFRALLAPSLNKGLIWPSIGLLAISTKAL